MASFSFGVGVPTQNNPGQFNYEFNEALKYEWRVKIQETSGLSLFDEARGEVNKTLTAPEGTKTTELLHTMGNTFCRGFYGKCDDTSLYGRLIRGCELARTTALEKMDNNFVRNNTDLLLASYTSCYDLASDVIKSYKDAASIGIAQWNKEQIVKSHNAFTEESQNTFQEKVGNMWDVFKKKLTNFVRSVQGITRNVNVRG